METNDFSVTSIDFTDIDRVRLLWEEHNASHAALSVHFSDHFKTMTFEKRKAEFREKAGKGDVRTDICFHNSTKEIIGYCVSNLILGKGEIDSLFVKKEYRGRGVGTLLVDAAMAWMRSRGADDIFVNVAVGNEKAFKFYGQFGLVPRLTLLTLKNRHS
jgi:diamine N-acetyltransferase